MIAALLCVCVYIDANKLTKRDRQTLGKRKASLRLFGYREIAPVSGKTHFFVNIWLMEEGGPPLRRYLRLCHD